MEKGQTPNASSLVLTMMVVMKTPVLLRGPRGATQLQFPVRRVVHEFVPWMVALNVINP